MMIANIKKGRLAAICAVVLLAFSGTAFSKTITQKAWVLDFESGITWDSGSFSFNKNYNSSVFNLEDGEYNNVLKMPTENKDLGTLGTLRLNDTIEEKDYILSFEFCALQENARFVTQWQTTDGKVITCFTVNNNGVAGFSKTGAWAVNPSAGITQYYGGAEYEAGKWHTVEMAVDLDSKTRYYYIDGVYSGECTDTNFGSGLVGNIAILHGKTYVSGDVDSENQAVYFDNFKVTYKSNIIDGIDFERGTDYIQNNMSESMGIQNQDSYMTVIEENDQNRVGAIKTYKSDALSNSLMNIYFRDLPVNSPYRLSFRFKHTLGAQIDIVPVSDARLGYLRICEDGSVKIADNWGSIKLESATPCLPEVWHTLDIVFDPVNKTGTWYLDGEIIKEQSYMINGAEGALSDISFQAIGTSEMVENQTSVLLIDNIEAEALSEEFFAKASAKENKIILRFNEYPNSFDTSKVTVTDSSGNELTVSSTEASGKVYTFNLESSCEPGEAYIAELPSGITSVFGKTLVSDNIRAEAVPDNFEIEILPSKTGGIFTDEDSISFDISVKNQSDAANFSGAVRILNEKGDYLWTEKLSFETSDTEAVNPQYELGFGRFYLEVLIKSEEQTAYLKKRIPFSVIFSNGIRNGNMGLSTHYTTGYETGLSDYDKEIRINALAGFGLNREEFQWDQYEKKQGVYGLTEKQEKLFLTLQDNGLKPMSILYNAIWIYGREEGGIAEFMPMPVTNYQKEKYAAYLRQAIADTIEYDPVYEIGNEWNLGYWNKVYTWKNGESVTLTVKDHYIPMMKLAYETIKSQNPNAQVAGLAVGNEDSIEFIKECIDNGAAEYCDYISIHPYSVRQSPEEYDIRSIAGEVRELLKTSKKPDMPIIFSEWGWTSAPGVLSEEMQAAYSVRGAALVGDLTGSLIWYGGQEKDYITSILEQNFGFVNGNKAENPLSAKPVYIAMSCYNSLVGDKATGELVKDENGTYTRVYKGKDKNIIQIWNPDGDEYIKIADDTLSGEGVLYDMYGNAKTVTAKDGFFEVLAEEKPCYLEVLSFSVTSADFSQNGSEVGFDADIVNNSSKTESLTIFIASYSADGRLLDVNMQKMNLESGFNGVLSTPKITKDEKVSLVKGFLWNEAGMPIVSKILTD